MQCINGVSLSKCLVCYRFTERNRMALIKTMTFTLTNSANCVVLSAPLNVSNNTTCCLLVCSEWPPIANPIFTTATPISCWMLDCTACTCQTTTLTLPWPASVHSMLLKVGWHLPTRPVLALVISIHDVLRPCVTSMLKRFSLLHAWWCCAGINAIAARIW